MVGVDLAAQRLTLDTHGESVTLDLDFLSGRTVHGDPTLVHGYAITAHVAQGVTVDRAFVLASAGLDRELGYTALSRGRHSNRLYLSTQADTDRDEFAPAESPGDPLARLTAALARSSAEPMAIDAGRSSETPDPSLRFDEAKRALARAVRERRAIETSKSRWMPGRRKQLDRLRSTETEAAQQVRDLTRETDEQRHAARPFVEERQMDDWRAASKGRAIERRLDRERDRGLGRGRG